MKAKELQVVRDTFITAIEQGISYWAMLDYSQEAYDSLVEQYPDEVFSERLFEGVMLHGLNIKIYDVKSPSNFLGNINQKEIVDGLERMKENTPEHYGNMFNGNMDAETADVFMQMVVMSEIVYG